MQISKKTISRVIKSLIVLLLLAALYWQIFHNKRFDALWLAFQNELSPKQTIWLVLAILLMPVNWAFETLKWRALIRRFSGLGFWRAYQAVLAGVAVSLFTPNRIGEYGGRVLLIESGKGWKAVGATLVGSAAQMLALLSGGIVGLAIFASQYFLWEPYILWSVQVAGLILAVALLLIYWHIDRVATTLKKLPMIQRWKPLEEIFELFKTYEKSELKLALFFSWARYFTYCTQYWLMLRFFGVEISLHAAWPAIASIFFLQTSVPLPPAISLLARGEIALLIWSALGANEVSVLAATFGLFILNLCLPALLGGWVIVKTNDLKS